MNMVDSRQSSLRQHDEQRGTILVCVLACLVIMSSLGAATVRGVLRDRREVRIEQQLRQTELLCEAGVARATRALHESSAYIGEQWTPNLSESLWQDAVVRINVESSQDSNARNIEVTASLGSNAHYVRPMQRSYTFTIETPTPSTAENQ